MKSYKITGLAVGMLTFGVASLSNATFYDFAVEFNGSSHTVISPSLDPLSTVLVTGDTFTYNYVTAGDDYFEVINYPSPGFWPWLFLEIDTPDDDISADMSYTLFNDSTIVAQAGEQESYSTNYLTNTELPRLVQGTMFDQIEYNVTIQQVAGTTLPSSLILAEYQPLELNNVLLGGTIADPEWLQYVQSGTGEPSPVPEPAAMFIFGTGLVGLLGSRLRKIKN